MPDAVQQTVQKWHDIIIIKSNGKKLKPSSVIIGVNGFLT
jgi:hypothetical protein